ncbi:MAG: hypothetical protein WKF41_09415 [Gaiellaceae bacterium]
MTQVLIATNLPPELISDTTLVSAHIDAFGAAQYEIRCDLELGDGTRLSTVIAVNTATAFGAALIGQAALSRESSDAEIGHHASYRLLTTEREAALDDIPF